MVQSYICPTEKFRFDMSCITHIMYKDIWFIIIRQLLVLYISDTIALPVPVLRSVSTQYSMGVLWRGLSPCLPFECITIKIKNKTCQQPSSHKNKKHYQLIVKLILKKTQKTFPLSFQHTANFRWLHVEEKQKQQQTQQTYTHMNTDTHKGRDAGTHIWKWISFYQLSASSCLCMHTVVCRTLLLTSHTHKYTPPPHVCDKA